MILMMGSAFGGLVGRLYGDSYVDRINSMKTIGVLKNMAGYNIMKSERTETLEKIWENERRLDGLGFWARLLAKDTLAGPGIATTAYLKEKMERGERLEYMPPSVAPSLDMNNTPAFLDSYAPGWRNGVGEPSLARRLKYLAMAGICRSGYSIPFFNAAVSGHSEAVSESAEGEELKKRRIWPWIVGGAVIIGSALLYNAYLAPWADPDKDGMNNETEDKLRWQGVNTDNFRPDPVIKAAYEAKLSTQEMKAIQNLAYEQNTKMAIDRIAGTDTRIRYRDGFIKILSEMSSDKHMSDSDLSRFGNLDMDDFTDAEELDGPYASILDPLRPNPLVGYALTKNLDFEIIKNVSKLEYDGFDESERILLDDLYYIGNRMIPSDIKSLYWTNKEIVEIQKNFIAAAIADGKYSAKEIDAMAHLKSNFSDRWNIIKDVVNSGMVKDENLVKDWDLDGGTDSKLNNITEIIQGTNPLNELETDPKNRSEVYVINVAGRDYNIGPVINNDVTAVALFSYHMMAKHGIPKNNIYFICDDKNIPEGQRVEATLLYTDLYKEWNGKDVLNEFGKIDFYKKGALSVKDVYEVFENLKDRIDGNDLLLFHISAHGSHIENEAAGIANIGEDYIKNYDINSMLRSIGYGRAIVHVMACESDSITKNLDKSGPQTISPIKDTLSFGYVGSAGTGLDFQFWENVSVGKPANKALGYQYAISYFKEEKPYGYCPWISNFNPIINMPKVK